MLINKNIMINRKYRLQYTIALNYTKCATFVFKRKQFKNNKNHF